MINIAAEVKPYQFKDGDTLITCNEPSEELYRKYIHADTNDVDGMIGLVTETINHMLKEEDKHYADEIGFRLKVVLMKDYFQYHTTQMEERFPSSASTN